MLGNVVVEEASIWLSFVVKTELCVVKGEVRQKKIYRPKVFIRPILAIATVGIRQFWQ